MTLHMPDAVFEALTECGPSLAWWTPYDGRTRHIADGLGCVGSGPSWEAALVDLREKRKARALREVLEAAAQSREAERRGMRRALLLTFAAVALLALGMAMATLWR